MTHLYNDPADFADEMREGFVAANPRLVRSVRGGVVRASATPSGTVAVVVGGGSGHYPAFAGLVGAGLAAGAAMGNLFASPSAQQIVSVARAAEAGSGVLFAYGNYAGDVLNFDQAQAQLRAEGVECSTVVVTDDISSAPAGESHQRRGVAGGLVVYKVAGAAAASGAALAEVAAVASRANARTRTIGVAFSGCTLPGAREALFTVPTGTMAVGLGVHGEPGISEEPLPTADELAELFVEKLLTDLPDGVSVRGSRVALVLNGLGSVKYEELFVVYRRIAQLARERGLIVADAQVGEFVTSFEMAGASLTVCWLDDQLEELWLAPAVTAAFTRAGVDGRVAALEDPAPARPSGAPVRSFTEASDASRAAAAVIARGLSIARLVIDDARDELGRLDSIAGDGDHGIGMQRGISAAHAAADEALAAGAGAGTTLRQAGAAWSDRAGGTSGAIWGLILTTVADGLGDTRAVDTNAVAVAVRAAVHSVARFGKVDVGDKTLFDALEPFATALEASALGGRGIEVAWAEAAESATAAAVSTADLVPRVGRARTHGTKSLGSPDPGAVSFALIVTSVLPVNERTQPHGK